MDGHAVRHSICRRRGPLAVAATVLVALALAPTAQADLSVGVADDVAAAVEQPAATAVVEAAAPVVEPVSETATQVSEPVVEAVETVVAPATDAAGKTASAAADAVVKPAADAVEDVPVVGEVVQTAAGAADDVLETAAPATEPIAPVADAVGSALDDLKGGALPSLPVDAPGAPGLPQPPDNRGDTPASPGVIPGPTAPAPSSPFEPAPAAPDFGDGASTGSPVSSDDLAPNGWPIAAVATWSGDTSTSPLAGATEPGGVITGAAGASIDRVRPIDPGAGMPAGGAPSALGGAPPPATALLAVLCTALALAVAVLSRRLVAFERPVRQLAFVALLERPG